MRQSHQMPQLVLLSQSEHQMRQSHQMLLVLLSLLVHWMQQSHEMLLVLSQWEHQIHQIQ
jgi:hypothetical protein